MITMKAIKRGNNVLTMVGTEKGTYGKFLKNKCPRCGKAVHKKGMCSDCLLVPKW